MSEEGKPHIDVGKFSDFEISLLAIERDVAQYKVERIDELLNEYGRVKGLVEAEIKESPSSERGFVDETMFNILKFDDQKGDRLGDYQVAFKSKNLLDKFSSAYGILRKNNATIKNRYHGPGYVFGLWLYGEGKIYRQKLKTT